MHPKVNAESQPNMSMLFKNIDAYISESAILGVSPTHFNTRFWKHPIKKRGGKANTKTQNTALHPIKITTSFSNTCFFKAQLFLILLTGWLACNNSNYTVLPVK